jgi:hypothetical protein
MKNKPTKAPPPATVTELNQMGVDAMPSRYEIAKRAYCFQLNQAHPQRRDVQIAWSEADTPTIDCDRNDRVRVIVRLAANPQVVVFRGQIVC